MILDEKIAFSKQNLDQYLRELAKEFRKRNGKTMPAEIILTGGASIVANYGFRDMTYDIDAIILASGAMREAIHYVGEKFNLPAGWLNTDFMRTNSYSPKLIECSAYYKTFSNKLTVRTISGEYLIAMKLVSGRKYKNDLSDITGILLSHEKMGDPITMDRIDHAVRRLYGSWDSVSESTREFIEHILKDRKYMETYLHIRDEEKKSREILIEFTGAYPEAANEKNVEDILQGARRKLQNKK